jgi:hypothetical protein
MSQLELGLSHVVLIYRKRDCYTWEGGRLTQRSRSTQKGRLASRIRTEQKGD